MKALLLAFFCLIACNSPERSGFPPSSAEVPEPPTTSSARVMGVQLERPKNIILMIGDGMGISQITAGMYANGNRLELERCTVVGLHKPHAADKLITDSAAGATAFACGKKTNNGMIGMTPDGSPCQTILEEAESRGLATGLITTSTIVHATPAAFIAHQPSRKNMEKIADDIHRTKVDLLIGGGKKYFDRREKDDRNLIEEWMRGDYVVKDYFQEDFDRIVVPRNSSFVYFTADNDPLPAAQGREYLPKATRLAPEFLKTRSDRGFFLMVEGAQIDWGGHANDANYIISEMLDFDKAVGAALNFAESNRETLVIITADHETGGFAINPGSSMDSMITEFTSRYHTASMVPVFAYGPGAELFSGVYDNTEIYHLMRKALGFPKAATER